MISFTLEENMLNTLIPNTFIDEYMPQANPAYSCVYIYALKNCALGAAGLNIRDLAKTFNILESDVVNAWEYWAELGLVKIHRRNNEICGIEFLPIPKTESRLDTEHDFSEPELSDFPSEYEVLEEAPQYSPKELELYKNSYEEIHNLFKKAEEILGKMLDSGDLSILYSFYDWLRFPTDLILFLLEYCAANGHRRMRYIEAVAVDWAENNIKTVDAAVAYLDIFNRDYRQILRALGISGRNPAPKEIEYMDKWLGEYNLPLDIILEACDKTIIITGKGQFAYADKILTTWANTGVKTIEDIKELDSRFKSSASEVKGKPKKSARANRFANFKEREKDYNEVEKREMEFLLKYLEDKNEQPNI